MISLVEGAARQRTPNEIALNILLASLTVVFLLAVASLAPMAAYAGAPQPILVLVALLVCLIPTTIGALLSAIGIAGMDRLVQRNVLAMSGRAVEAAGDVGVLLLDKTGTITYGNRQAAEVRPAAGVTQEAAARAAFVSSLSDETPEGRSIVTLARERYAVDDLSEALLQGSELVPFEATTRMSGLDLPDGSQVRKGAGSMVRAWVLEHGGTADDSVDSLVEEIARAGGTPLVVAERPAGGSPRVLGVIQLKDVVKEGMRERFDELRAMGIRTVMITGDGTNDAPALAQADVGVAMNTGTSAAKEAGNMVDLDSNPTKLIEIVEIGKQLLITRGALTTFSIANDLAKYFAIIPAMFATVYPGLGLLDIMKLHNPQTAILSAVIFNALIIIALVPLALRGARYRPQSASRMLRRNLLVYGLGGLIAPFIGIKLIDLLLSLFPALN